MNNSSATMLTTVFTTREIAIGIWTLGLIVWALAYPGVRSAFQHLLGAAFHRKLIVPFLGAAAYTALVVWSLAQMNLWTSDLLKDTILWFLFAGVALAFSGITQSWEPLNWRKILVEQVAVIVLLEYIVNTYTFSLPVELLLVPILTIIVTLNAFARTDAKFASVAKLTGCLQGVFGIAVLAVAMWQAVTHLKQLATWDTVRSVALAPLLSILILPFVYGFTLLSAYEQLFIRLTFGEKKEPRLMRHIKWRLFKHLGMRQSAVGAFGREHAADLIRVKSRADIDRLLAKDSTDWLP
jgi:hypothetical protein